MSAGFEKCPTIQGNYCEISLNINISKSSVTRIQRLGVNCPKKRQDGRYEQFLGTQNNEYWASFGEDGLYFSSSNVHVSAANITRIGAIV